MADTRRSLPSVDRLLQAESVRGWLQLYPQPVVVEALREALHAAREALGLGLSSPSLESLVSAAAQGLERRFQPTLRPVINATGVILHTNLGRAPLSDAARAAMDAVASGYSSLEYDLDAGERGSRHEHLTALLRTLTGSEAALVVNNNASAVLVALAALASAREVVISRGQLVEIGGGFRIPDVLRQSGARLVEVGTTNRTYVDDYASAITDETAILLRVHASNFRVTGFVHSAGLDELVELAHGRGLLVVDDLGSGSLLPTERYGLAHEPMVQESLAAGADLVCFSGDKLLGGPQAGLIVGKAEAIGRLRRHPLTRALRPDKITLAGLQATLVHYVREEEATAIPIWRMIASPVQELERRAEAILQKLEQGQEDRGRQLAAASRTAGGPAALEEQVMVAVLETRATVGGGSLPEETLPSRALALTCAGEPVQQLAGRLRAHEPPIIGRILDDRVLLDLRTVREEEDQELLAGLRALP